MALDKSLDPVMVGSAVYTRDGHKVGMVKEVRGAYFRVEHRVDGTYWLPRESVSMATRRGVMLTLDDARLAEARVRLSDDSEHAPDAADRPLQ